MNFYPRFYDLHRHSQRPVFIWGAGMREHAFEARILAKSAGIPVALTWGAIDLFNHDEPLNMGSFGTHGVKAANLAVQNADLIISLGCRLDTKATGTPSDFAPKAQIVMVEIDQAEIDKMEKVGRPVIGWHGDCIEMIKAIQGLTYEVKNREWAKQCEAWKKEHIPDDDPNWVGKPYALMREIAKHTTPDDIIVSDTGNTYGWIMQGFPFKGERFIHASNFTPMGYGLGAAIGSACASDSRVIAIVGDGGALMSIQELATIARHNLNIKIILLDNKGHSMCRTTQRQWLGGTYPATSIEGGLGFPEWTQLARSFGLLAYHSVQRDYWSQFALPALVFDAMNEEVPKFLQVDIDPDATLAHQVKYGEPLA